MGEGLLDAGCFEERGVEQVEGFLGEVAGEDAADFVTEAFYALAFVIRKEMAVADEEEMGFGEATSLVREEGVRGGWAWDIVVGIVRERSVLYDCHRRAAGTYTRPH